MHRCLIFDADDTLWENNIYFERAIEEFFRLMQPVAGAAALHELLRQMERELIPIGGYGTRNFVMALKEVCCRVSRGANGAEYLRGIEEIGERLLYHPVDLRPGVSEVLPALRADYRLMLFSKGDLAEQTDKLGRSGLGNYFDQVIITAEKDRAAYLALLGEHELAGETTFMIGNSPRSDVVPALAAGLWAVYVPHPNTWEHEDHPIEPHPRLLHAASFADLPDLLST
jgi:putative hydrolase of the HAD superfamily